jgi:hypothetical protein
MGATQERSVGDIPPGRGDINSAESLRTYGVTMQPAATKESRKRRDQMSPDELRRLFQNTDVEQTVPTDEGAVLLGVEPQTMRRWACEGSGPIRPRKVNGRLRWSVSEIRALLNGNTPTVAGGA